MWRQKWRLRLSSSSPSMFSYESSCSKRSSKDRWVQIKGVIVNTESRERKRVSKLKLYLENNKNKGRCRFYDNTLSSDCEKKLFSSFTLDRKLCSLSLWKKIVTDFMTPRRFWQRVCKAVVLNRSAALKKLKGWCKFLTLTSFCLHVNCSLEYLNCFTTEEGCSK